MYVVRDHLYSHICDRNSISDLTYASYTINRDLFHVFEIEVAREIAEEDRFKRRTTRKISGYSTAVISFQTPL